MYHREIRIVLVEPSHPGNIGGVARALKTMGLESLWLVNPARYPDPQAEWRAAQATDVLRTAHVVDDLSVAIDDCSLVVGTSTRGRRIPWPTRDADELAVELAEAEETQPAAILFGREASGLTNDELQRCHLHLQIPANPVYPSLNLAMAVQVVCYELHKAHLRAGQNAGAAGLESLNRGWDRTIATTAEMESFFEHLERALRRIDFYDPKAPRQALTRLKRMFMRIRPDEAEVGMLRGILTRVEHIAEEAETARTKREASTGPK